MAYNAADTAEEWWDASGGPGMISHLRANPVPTALAAVGLAWLAFSDGRNGRRGPGWLPIGGKCAGSSGDRGVG